MVSQTLKLLTVISPLGQHTSSLPSIQFLPLLHKPTSHHVSYTSPITSEPPIAHATPSFLTHFAFFISFLESKLRGLWREKFGCFVSLDFQLCKSLSLTQISFFLIIWVLALLEEIWILLFEVWRLDDRILEIRCLVWSMLTSIESLCCFVKKYLIGYIYSIWGFNKIYLHDPPSVRTETLQAWDSLVYFVILAMET